jgi:hypothetical protein
MQNQINMSFPSFYFEKLVKSSHLLITWKNLDEDESIQIRGIN